MNLDINYTESKFPKSKTPILFLHGAWHGAWCWEESFTQLFAEKGYNSYSFNLRGHGKSKQNLNSISIKDYVDDLKQVLEHIKVQPIIIAHSMGGLILQKYLEEHSCAAAILMASVPPSGVFNITKKLLLTTKYGLISALKLKLFGIVDSPEKAKWAFFSQDIDDDLLNRYAKQLQGESFRAFIDMLLPNIKANYHTKIPVLTLGGRNDNIFTPNEVIKTAKKYNSDVKIFENTAHDMMLESTNGEVADYIDNWIQLKITVNN